MTVTVQDRLHPLAPMAELTYDDGVVRVSARTPGRAAKGGRTAHFRVHVEGRRVLIQHCLAPEQLDNDIAEMIAEELFRSGLLSGTGLFERIFVGVVRTTVAGALPAWTMFYENTLAKIRSHWGELGAAGTQLAEMAPVYRRALDLVGSGPVLDVGSCFGFFPLLLAETGAQVIATDISRGSMELLATVSLARGTRLQTLSCDAASIPLDNSVHTVTVLHLLEHLDPTHGRAVLAEAVRLAARRVVVAVPFEDEPDPIYGHVRTFDLPELAALAIETGLPFTVTEHHGGWLVLDTA
ncbi:mycofactocin oligosaccharide methyltransferase MftM [Nocardia sp. NPDC058518]|uniref:mycofactocin oligosaccharide methyltransferase MftM n=1 Tax=Nocardia sp. NPDC058518 TaxID=3346534 RepID=UPI0036572CB6